MRQHVGHLHFKNRTHKNSVTRVCQGNRPNVVHDLPQIMTKSGSTLGNVLLIADSIREDENSSSVLHTARRALTNCNLECLDVSRLTSILGSHLYPKNIYIFFQIFQSNYTVVRVHYKLQFFNYSIERYKYRGPCRSVTWCQVTINETYIYHLRYKLYIGKFV